MKLANEAMHSTLKRFEIRWYSCRSCRVSPVGLHQPKTIRPSPHFESIITGNVRGKDNILQCFLFMRRGYWAGWENNMRGLDRTAPSVGSASQTVRPLLDFVSSTTFDGHILCTQVHVWTQVVRRIWLRPLPAHSLTSLTFQKSTTGSIWSSW